MDPESFSEWEEEKRATKSANWGMVVVRAKESAIGQVNKQSHEIDLANE